MIVDPLFYFLATPAVILYGLSKGGFGGVAILSMPMLSLAISPVQAAAIMLPVLMVQDVVTVWSYRKTWDKTTLLYLAPGALLGIATGWAFASLLSEAQVRLLVGLVAIAFCLDRWLRQAVANPPPRPHAWRSATLLGWISGYTSFLIHVGGPPFNMYVLPRGLPRDVFVGTAGVFFAAVNLVKVTPFLALGQFSATNLATAAVLFPLAVAANLAGIQLVRRLDVATFYRLIYVLTFAVGLILTGTGLWALVA